MGLGSRLRRAWAALPRWARWLLAVYLIGFADGTAAHARDLPGPGSMLTQDSRRFRCEWCCPALQGSCGIQRRIPGPIPHDKSGRVRPDRARVQCYHRDSGAVELGRQAG
jgi:hypothetical protein